MIKNQYFTANQIDEEAFEVFAGEAFVGIYEGDEFVQFIEDARRNDADIRLSLLAA